MFALEDIMRHQRRRHAEIVEVLGTLVREAAHDPDYEAQLVERSNDGTHKIRPRSDIQAALTVLGRSELDRPEYQIRLADIYLLPPEKGV